VIRDWRCGSSGSAPALPLIQTPVQPKKRGKKEVIRTLRGINEVLTGLD
jgi:hypothetical protein